MQDQQLVQHTYVAQLVANRPADVTSCWPTCACMLNIVLFSVSTLRCSDESCSWGYLSTGIQYQVLAGPAFIIVFALSSLPMGLLASVQKLRRTFLLALCIFLWSSMTLLGGFAHEYWHMVLSRFGLGVL